MECTGELKAPQWFCFPEGAPVHSNVTAVVARPMMTGAPGAICGVRNVETCEEGGE
jgi:hypothetical protein